MNALSLLYFAGVLTLGIAFGADLPGGAKTKNDPVPADPASNAKLPLKIPEGTPADVRDALKWFDTLGLPSTKGLSRVRVTHSWRQDTGKNSGSRYVTGWLVAENDKTSRIFVGPDVETAFIWDGTGPWPLHEWKFTAYEKNEDGWHSEGRIEKLSLKAEAEAILKELTRKKDWRTEGFPRFKQVLSQRAEVFLIGRACLEEGLPVLGVDLLKRAPGLLRDVNEKRTFRQMLEDELATVALWKITLDFGAATIPRSSLLADLETALKRYPASHASDAMTSMAKTLRVMADEDAKHAAELKPFDNMTPAEQATELVFQLRNQNGVQRSQPGWCEIFGTWDKNPKEDSPAHKLVRMGHTAVPPLIAAIGSQRYSRSVGFHRDFHFSHTVLTVWGLCRGDPGADSTAEFLQAAHDIQLHEQ